MIHLEVQIFLDDFLVEGDEMEDLEGLILVISSEVGHERVDDSMWSSTLVIYSIISEVCEVEDLHTQDQPQAHQEVSI